MHDVVIAGGGPVGLFLAGELALSGCSVLILERDREPTSPLKALPLGLRGLNAGSAETLHRRGLLEAVLDASGADGKKVGADPDASEAPAPRDVSHFAGMGLDAGGIDTSALPLRLPGPVRDDLGLTALLIRPDGIVAWADDHPDTEAFQQAATRWLGHPHD
ncbi:aromatic-ring hydroxylase C-terminal domain-containing protein [Kitasatospora sp. NPDC004240]